MRDNPKGNKSDQFSKLGNEKTCDRRCSQRHSCETINLTVSDSKPIETEYRRQNFIINHRTLKKL